MYMQLCAVLLAINAHDISSDMTLCLLYIGSLEDAVVLKLKESSKSKLRGKFSALVAFAAETLDKKGKDFQNFKTYVITYFSLGRHILNATNYREVFNIIGQENKWDYLNYFPLLELLNQFIKDESREMCDNYQHAVTAHLATERITETMSSHNLTKMCHDCGQDPSFHEINMKLHPHRVTEQSLTYVHDIWESLSRYFSIPSLKAVLGHIPSMDAEADCLCATLPPQACVELSTEDELTWKTFMKANNIAEISFDNGRVYNVKP